VAFGRADRQVEWCRIRGLLQAEFGDGIFKSWLKPMTLVDRGRGGIAIQLPTRFMCDRVQSHYGERIHTLWLEADPGLAGIGFEVNPVLRDGPAQAPQRPAPAASPAQDDFATPVQSGHTFDAFIVGESNALAHSLCHNAAEGNAPPSGLLYLFGGVGLGKTHLMQALALRLCAERPDRPVLYLDADDFRQHFFDAVVSKTIAAFRRKIRSAAVLMVDDVHLLEHSHRTQEEFLHTINALACRERLIAVSGNRSPIDLEGIHERIRSRLSTGVSASVQPLETDYPLRRRFLERRAAELAAPMPEEVVVFLAERITSNMRVLQGAVNRLDSHVRHFGGALTVDRAEKVLSDLLPANDRTPTVEAIKKLVCERYNIRPAEMDSARRARSVARPRQMAMYLAKQLTTLSLPDIGRRFDRDHSTVLYGVRQIDRLMKDDAALAEEVAALRRMLEP